MPEVDGHGVALIGLWVPGDNLADITIRAQCECGWFASFPHPVTLERVNQVVTEYLPHEIFPPRLG
jgi:hypothetical protein